MTDEPKKLKRRRRWVSFTLRSFLLFVVILGMWLAWYVYRVERQRKAIAWVKANGGEVYYDFEIDYDGPGDSDKKPGPKWLHDALGVDYFANVAVVYIDDNEISDITPLKSLSSLKILDLSGEKIKDLTPISELKNLEGLSLTFTGVTDLSPLTGLQKLETLVLVYGSISDLTPIETLTSISRMKLIGAQFDDVEPLFGLTNLEVLILEDTRIRDADIERLQQALPNCWIREDDY